MPSDITTPAPTAAIDRLTLGTEAVRGTDTSTIVFCGSSCCSCLADEAE